MKRFGVIVPKTAQAVNGSWLYPDLAHAKEQARVMSVTQNTECFVVEVIGAFKSEAVWREDNPAPTPV